MSRATLSHNKQSLVQTLCTFCVICDLIEIDFLSNKLNHLGLKNGILGIRFPGDYKSYRKREIENK